MVGQTTSAGNMNIIRNEIFRNTVFQSLGQGTLQSNQAAIESAIVFLQIAFKRSLVIHFANHLGQSPFPLARGFSHNQADMIELHIGTVSNLQALGTYCFHWAWHEPVDSPSSHWSYSPKPLPCFSMSSLPQCNLQMVIYPKYPSFTCRKMLKDWYTCMAQLKTVVKRKVATGCFDFIENVDHSDYSTAQLRAPMYRYICGRLE